MADFSGKIDVKKIKSLVSIISETLDEAIISVTKDGWRILQQSRDGNKCISLLIKAAAFEAYNFNEDMRIIVNTGDLMTYLERFKETIQIGTNNNLLCMKAGERAFDLRLLAATDVSQTTDEMLERLKKGATETVTVPFSAFKEIVDDIKATKSFDVVTELKGDSLVFRCGEETDKALYRNSIRLGRQVKDCRIKTNFEYLKILNKESLPVESFEAMMGNNYPIVFKFSTKDVALEYIIAPIVEEGE
jgi:DNA polymerase III sliding clamp (beta) subunit (PCNA family)